MVHLSALSLALNRPGAVGLTLEQAVAALFANNEQGAWYDPSDFSTMFQVSTGATPVTAVEQPVGLILDKRKGLVLGPELNDSIDVVANWTAFGTNTVAQDGSAIKVTYSNNQNGAYTFLRDASGLSSNLTVGQWYKVTGEAKVNTGSANVSLFATTQSDSVAITSTTYVAWAVYFLCSNATTNYIAFNNLGVGEEIWVRNISVRLLDGNHAYQTGSTARPVLRARYNLLTYSEQFDNAAWANAGGGATISANSIAAPDGTTTADTMIEAATSGNRKGKGQTASFVSGATYTCSVYAKAKERSFLYMIFPGNAVSSNRAAGFTLTGAGSVSSLDGSTVASIVPLANGWYRCSVTATATATASGAFEILLADAGNLTATNPSYTGDGTSGLYVWGADLRVGTSAGDYQRIAAATDYATTSTITGQPFRPYLNFDAADGTADSLLTAAVDFTATDEMTVAVGLNKTSDASSACCVELSASADDTNGSFALFAPSSSGTNKYDWRVRGSVYNSVVTTSTTYNAPVRAVVVGIGEISGDVTTLRANKTQLATSASNLGTGNFGTHAMFIGRRNNASLPLSGHIHGLIVRAKTCTAGELDSLETYLAEKAGLTL